MSRQEDIAECIKEAGMSFTEIKELYDEETATEWLVFLKEHELRFDALESLNKLLDDFFLQIDSISRAGDSLVLKIIGYAEVEE